MNAKLYKTRKDPGEQVSFIKRCSVIISKLMNSLA
jgi:hypothetical protein